MRLKSNTSSRPTSPTRPPRPAGARRRRSGLTLIEVVAGLALLSTLLVAILTTKAKLTRQWASAQQRLRATAAADALLTDWWRDPKTFPRQAAGAVPDEPGLRWRMRVVPNEAVNRLAASVVRLEVIAGRDGPVAGEVLVAVELVLNDEPLKTPQPGADAAGGGAQ